MSMTISLCSRILTATGLICLLITPALAGAPGGVEGALERASRAIDKDPGLATETKEALKELLNALEEERGRAAAPAAHASTPATTATTATATATVLDRLDVYGDFRYRHETNDTQGSPTRNRERIRMRLGADYRLNDQLSIGGRVSTGSRTDAKSSHNTLGEGFHRFDINLDRAFFDYRPSGAPGLWLKGGKFAHPFWKNPVYGEVLWDGDVQPEGGAVGYGLGGLGVLDSLDVTIGEYILVEQALADEATAFVAQLAGTKKLSEAWSAGAAVGLYHWSNLTPDGNTLLLDDNQGNATIDDDGDDIADRFSSRFEVVNPIAALTYSGGQRPFTLAGEYIYNRKAASGRDSGWGLGAALGRARAPGDWRLFYQYYELDEDAFFSVVAGDDTLRTTNARSHIFGLDYKVSEHFKPRLWGLVSRRLEQLSGDTDPTANDTRLRLDLNFSF